MKRRGFLKAGVVAGIGAAHLGCSLEESLPSGPAGKSATAQLEMKQ